MLHDFDTINDMLNAMADEGMLEPMAEPVDTDECDPWDYAEVTGLWDEMYPEPIDADDLVW